MSRAEARRVAVAHFGGVQRVREEHHDVRRLQWGEDFVNDARFALRSPARTPAIAGAAVITLALGVGAAVGRTFTFAETWKGSGPRTVVLSDRVWRVRFGADRGIVGKSIVLDGDTFMVVGVMPKEFGFA